MKLEELTNYSILEMRRIEDLNSSSCLLEHKKSGARIALLSNEDENKVFYIGFRTPPKNSTGVAHIIEHSVLEGSRDFPVKDPFIELAKGSLNTFLNAMTYPDKTVYPVASCNDTDFQNLMHVYLDAVFYPNIYKEKKIFEQEGWHYELEAPEAELSINGVVYNEMKGAFSSPDDVLERKISETLYPDTPYAMESGGDPDVIPELTYEEFLDFHRKFYHPSNSYIYLYGNMDMAEKLDYLDREYLSHFDRIEVDSEISVQPPFTEKKETSGVYPITDSEPEKDNTYLSYNIVVGDNLDRERYIAFQVLDYALCSAPGAPLKQALLDKKIGKDVYSYYENGLRQPYFSIIAKNANLSDKDAFVETIESELARLAKDGIDKKALKAGLNYYEFRYREADFGSYPAGLMYGLQVLDSWLYDDTKPFIHIEAGETYKSLRKKADTDYYEKLIRTYMIENRHKSILTLEPKKGLSKEHDDHLQKKLADYKAGLSPEEISGIVHETQELRKYQETPDTKEALSCIPLLKREDIRKEAEPLVNEIGSLGDNTVMYHELFTNHISYFRFLFDLKNVPGELFPYVGILKAVLGYVDTTEHSYGELFHEINMETGGITAVTNLFTNAKNLEECRVTFEIKAKTLEDNLGRAVQLSKEIMLHSRFDDEKRLYEILAELKSHLQSALISAGHSVAAGRAMSYFSRPAAIQEHLSGMPFYRLVDDLEKHFDSRKEELKDKLDRLVRCIFRPENLLLDYIGTKEHYEEFLDLAKEVKDSLFTDAVKGTPFSIEPEKRNEGFLSASQVQYVCRAGNFINKGLSYTGALRVLKVLMSYEYLWQEVRVKGGAYGCMCSFGKSGDSYFVSYRDPNLKETVEVYEKAADFVEHFDGDERTMTQYIIGAVSEMDTPLNPAAKGLRSMSAFLTNQTLEDLQKERDEVLSAGQEDIRALAAHIRAFMKDDCLCVVGNEEKLREEKDMFLHLENLY
ncbi:MAG TPA: insulinase family protein [Candidatus Eisenbergiella merdipullorum]|uniref:Insulinase family protein n=1 Tax=Candidatus Eisenbergiella merdipullorum TaxID=2838553 RepID=A0A9D2I4I1_9FIRM|nr:insulinase family protein [Candidatus Eisenbergiella merdipullorum]